jgi:acetylornithine/N-succinyldiaminopimelate aminotransferase
MSQTLFFEHQAQTTPYPTAMEVSRAEGMYIYDKEGNAYMDLVAGVSANITAPRVRASV